MNNYEKAKEEGINNYNKKFDTIHIDVNWQYEECNCKPNGKKTCKQQLESFLSSFAEKIKEGVEKDIKTIYVDKGTFTIHKP